MNGPSPSRLLSLGATCLALTSSLPAEPVDLKEMLRDALYQEEVSRDSEAAARSYQGLLARNDEERAFAATAQFRLAEVRRKQGRKDEAIAAYQLLLARYPEAETECRLARENLATLGAAAPAPSAGDAAARSPEKGDRAFLANLTAMEKSSPDALPGLFIQAIENGYPLSLTFLFEHSEPPKDLDLLGAARAASSLEMVNYILKRGVDLKSASSKGVFMDAMLTGQVHILKALLDAGFDPDAESPANPGFVTPLTSDRLSYSPPKVFQMLLEAKADVRKAAMPSGITPLHAAAKKGTPEAIGALLAAGADPNALTAAPDESSPLDLALLRGDDDCIALLEKAGGKTHDPNLLLKASGNEETFARLLDHGADVSRFDVSKITRAGGDKIAKIYLEHGGKASLEDINGWLGAPSWKYLVMLALERGAVPKEQMGFPNGDGRWNIPDPAFRRQMVEHGWKPWNGDLGAAVINDQKDEVRFLLDHGAELDIHPAYLAKIQSVEVARMLVDSCPQKERLLPTLLSMNLRSFSMSQPETDWSVRRLAAIALLLKGGAPFGEDKPGDAVRAAASVRAPGDLLPLVIEKGGKPEEDWLAAGFPADAQRNWDPADPGEISLASRSLLFRTFTLPRLQASDSVRWIGQYGKLGMTTLEERSPSAHPLPLAESIHWVVTSIESGIPLPSRLIVWRKQADGSFARFDVDLASDSPYPALEWGDVVDATGDAPSFDSEDFHALVRKVESHILAKVTLEVDGAPHEVTLHGGVQRSDAAYPQIRFQTAAQVVQGSWYLAPGRTRTGELTVLREGWPPRKCSVDAYPADHDLRLTGGDRVVWSTKPFDTKRRLFVSLASPGLPVFGYSRQLADPPPSGPLPWGASHVPPAPTPIGLMQFIAASYLYPEPYVLCFPDFSHIQVRSPLPDGSEKITDVDLQAGIEALPEDASAEQARALDIPLEPGDIVEIPSKEHAADAVWDGFTPAQRRAFSKALSYTIQFTDEDKQTIVRSSEFELPFIHTGPDGIVIRQPDKGTADPSLYGLLGPHGGTVVASSRGVTFTRTADWIYPREGWTYVSGDHSARPRGHASEEAPPPQPEAPKPDFTALPLAPAATTSP